MESSGLPRFGGTRCIQIDPNATYRDYIVPSTNFQPTVAVGRIAEMMNGGSQPRHLNDQCMQALLSATAEQLRVYERLASMLKSENRTIAGRCETLGWSAPSPRVADAFKQQFVHRGADASMQQSVCGSMDALMHQPVYGGPDAPMHQFVSGGPDARTQDWYSQSGINTSSGAGLNNEAHLLQLYMKSEQDVNEGVKQRDWLTSQLLKEKYKNQQLEGKFLHLEHEKKLSNNLISTLQAQLQTPNWDSVFNVDDFQNAAPADGEAQATFAGA